MSSSLYSQPPGGGGSRELPTEPGFYYWRPIPNCDWLLVRVMLKNSRLWNTHSQEFLDEGLTGEWIRIPGPEDLLRLMESAKWVMQDGQEPNPSTPNPQSEPSGA